MKTAITLSALDIISYPQADVFAFGIILCELIARVPADPDYLPRTEVNNISRFEQEGLPTGQLITKKGSLELEVLIGRPKENPRNADLAGRLSVPAGLWPGRARFPDPGRG